MLLEVGGVAQLARALASHVRGREFESHHLHHLAADRIIRGFFVAAALSALQNPAFMVS